jgi:hypothetical protein
MTAFGIGSAITERPSEMTYVDGVAQLGCGISLGGERLVGPDEVSSVLERCRAWPKVWSQRARSSTPDVALVQIGPWDVMPRRTSVNGPFVEPGEPEWDKAIQDEMLLAVDLFAAAGVYTLWTTAPAPNRNLDAVNHFAGSANADPARFAHLNSIIAELPSLRAGKVSVIDLAGWHAARPDDLDLRPDGIHLSGTAGLDVARDFLLQEILDQFDTAWRAGDISRLVTDSLANRQDPPTPPALSADEKMRIAIWSDERGESLRKQLASAKAPNDVRIVSTPMCGLARISQRQLDGDTRLTGPSCNNRAAIVSALKAFAPHLILVAPGLHEAKTVRVWQDEDQWKEPSDPEVNLWLAAEYGTIVDLAAHSGALVAIIGLSPGEGFPHTDAINEAVDRVAVAPDRSAWLSPSTSAAESVSWAINRLTGKAFPP